MPALLPPASRTMPSIPPLPRPDTMAGLPCTHTSEELTARKYPMHMSWHNLLFDPAQQIGAGEYTFRYRIQTHGLVIVKISNGLIVNWREYEIESPLPWDRFIGDNRF